MNSGPTDSGNLRRSSRTDLACPATVRVSGLPPALGQLINLSTHGVLVACPHELPLGSEARVTLELPDGEAPIELVALVVRQERSARDERPIDVALCFIHPAVDVVRRLSELVWQGV